MYRERPSVPPPLGRPLYPPVYTVGQSPGRRASLPGLYTDGGRRVLGRVVVGSEHVLLFLVDAAPLAVAAGSASATTATTRG